MKDGLANTTAAILAGGLGTRLRPVVDGSPKTLAPICGRPFVTFLLDQLADVGVRRVVLLTGYLSEQVESAIGGNYRGIAIIYSREPSALGTAGAIRHALDQIDSDPALIMNGDSYCTANLVRFYEAHIAAKAAGTILLVRQRDAARYGEVEIDADEHVTAFREKSNEIRLPHDAHDPRRHSHWVNAGIYLLGRSLLESIPTGRAVSLEREMMPAWSDSNLYGHRTDAELLDIGTPESFARAEAFLRKHAPSRDGQAVNPASAPATSLHAEATP